MSVGEQQIDSIRPNRKSAGIFPVPVADLRAWIRWTFASFSTPRSNTFVLLVLGIDVLFIGIHVFNLALKFLGMDPDSHVLDTLLNIEHDGSLPEIFNYLKLALVSGVLITLYIGSRAPLYLVLAGCFAFAGLDDGLRLHEQMGPYLADMLAVSAIGGATPGNIAEALYFVVLGTVFAGALAIAWYRADWIHRRRSLVFFVAISALFLFAVVIDLMHSLFGGESLVTRRLAGLVEDAGEMLVATFTIWLALGVLLRYGQRRDRAHRQNVLTS